MSEKLILEFYQMAERTPIAVILVHHCGEDPATAALTVAGFIASVKDAMASSSLDAGELVSRFVLWEAEISGSSISSRRVGTTFLQSASSYLYQLVRLRIIDGAVHVEIVTDEHSTEQELDEASIILTAAQLPTVFVASTQAV
jgi:hypothetical protein